MMNRFALAVLLLSPTCARSSIQDTILQTYNRGAEVGFQAGQVFALCRISGECKAQMTYLEFMTYLSKQTGQSWLQDEIRKATKP